LEALYHVFAYMKSHLDIGRVAFDPKTPVVDESAFNNGADWKESTERSKRNYHPRCQSRGDKG
jgi:hypothetical protein